MSKPPNSIDLGLAVLGAIRRPGERFSHNVIAAACGCTKSYILQVERKALKKLRNRLIFIKDQAIREICDHLFVK